MFELLLLLIVLAALGGMRGRGFVKRLKRELPKWVEAGLVEPKKAPLILEQASAGIKQHSLASMFAILGVILLAAGIITFFAANWQAMPKLLKLIVLFTAMWSAFAASIWGERREQPWLHQAMLLLGVLLFGANIMLIAQIYHIDAHYPDGVLTWSLGALLVAWVMRSSPVFVAGLVLAVIWSGMESIDFSRLHWPFLLLFSTYALLAVRRGWVRFAHLLMLALLIWTLFAYIHFIFDMRGGVVYLTQAFFLGYLALFVAGLNLELSGRYIEWAETVRHYAVVAGLMMLWALTFPDLLEAKLFVAGQREVRPAAELAWIVATLVMMAVAAVLALWHRLQTARQGLRQRWHQWGDLMLLITAVALVINLFVSGEHGAWMALLFNLLFFAVTLWLIYAGTHLESQPMINLGFLFFAMGLCARYFDLFWSLMDRSLFFMAGGVLLIGVAAILDRKRRRLIAELREESR